MSRYRTRHYGTCCGASIVYPADSTYGNIVSDITFNPITLVSIKDEDVEDMLEMLSSRRKNYKVLSKNLIAVW